MGLPVQRHRFFLAITLIGNELDYKIGGWGSNVMKLLARVTTPYIISA